jgi:hypothetical protein
MAVSVVLAFPMEQVTHSKFGSSWLTEAHDIARSDLSHKSDSGGAWLSAGPRAANQDAASIRKIPTSRKRRETWGTHISTQHHGFG